MTYCIVNGQCVPAKEATISIHDRGFRLGDGVFETLALHGGVPYQYDWHITRLEQGLAALKIPFDAARLREHCRALVRRNGAKDGLLRLQVTRGAGSRGYLPAPDNESGGASFVVETLPPAPAPAEPVRLWQSSLQKISAAALPVHAKLCQGVNSMLARMEAVENGCFEALLLNARQQLCETSSGNLFWVEGGRIYTPAAACGLLGGSTRAALKRLAEVAEAEAPLEALLAAQAVFISSVAWPLLPVSELLPTGKQWQNYDISHRLHRQLLADREEYAHTHAAEW